MKKVALGEKFEIVLDENMSTGYSWSYAADSDAINLVAEKKTYPEQNSFPLEGISSQKIWVFKAEKVGICTLEFTYIELWEEDQKPAQTMNYTIQVNKKCSKGIQEAKQQPLAILKTEEFDNFNEAEPFCVKLRGKVTTGYL